MKSGKDYLQEVQKFVTSQYWNSGVRITAGVMLPLLVLQQQNLLTQGMPFLFGSLFVSLTDTPGPIHHRRNGMIASTLLNAFTVLVTASLHREPTFLVVEIALFSFFFSLLNIYGARAGAVGTLALVIMLIHLSPLRENEPPLVNSALTLAGGLWYTAFSLVLYRLQPYRLVDQALGETLLLIADYVRARANFYKADSNVEETFNRVMKQQVEVLRAQNQMRELLFKTRQVVGDPSPKSRSVMMIFLESLDMFEETMYSYGDYESLQKQVPRQILDKFYSLILQVVAEIEHIGLSVQMGLPVKKMPALAKNVKVLEQELSSLQADSSFPTPMAEALANTIGNISGIVARLSRIVMYTRMEAHDPSRFPDQEIEKPVPATTFTLTLLKENLSPKSAHFRFALRITLAMLAALGVSALFSLSHAYWVMLTVITILKPVYNQTRQRNVQRVAGTLTGVLAGSALLYLVSNETVLFVTLIVCMVLAYSLLRLNYYGFVSFLTLYIIITFHFLDPTQFRDLIGERLIDTLIGSVIAAIASRFIFPVWQGHSIQMEMKKFLIAASTYLVATITHLTQFPAHRRQYNASRNDAIVALTNLSDNFQHMLAEPEQVSYYTQAHQFVIASHTLISRISSLTPSEDLQGDRIKLQSEKILDVLQSSAFLLEHGNPSPDKPHAEFPVNSPVNTLDLALALACEMKNIIINIKLQEEKPTNGV